MGLPWFINPHAALPTIERQWARYKQALAEANQPMPQSRPMILELSIAATRAAEWTRSQAIALY